MPENSRLVILDRDGVINQDSDSFIRSPEEWHAIPGSLEAIARLCREDYRVIVITNQSGISRGYYSINTLNQIHQKMLEELNHLGGEISAIFFCPHSDSDNCGCRKPKPGMFEEFSQRMNQPLEEVYAVGDSLRDLQAAKTAGAKPVLVKTGKGNSTLEAMREKGIMEDVPVFTDLNEFVDHHLSARPPEP